jgi:hypothetical protein
VCGDQGTHCQERKKRKGGGGGGGGGEDLWGFVSLINIYTSEIDSQGRQLPCFLETKRKYITMARDKLGLISYYATVAKTLIHYSYM